MKSSTNSHQCCPPETAKVITVQTVAGIQKFANSFVHVTGNNSVYYVSNAHQVTLISSQPVEVRGYDATTNPANYRNQIVYDLSSNEITYFSNAGVGVPLSSSVQLADLEALDNKFSSQLRDVTDEVAQLNEALAIEASAREETDATLNASIQALQEATQGLTDATVQTDTTVSGGSSTVSLIKTTGALMGEQTQTSMPLPVADATQAGVMNPATYASVQESAEKVDAILGGAVAIEGLAAEPTQAELTTAWQTATGQSALINRASIYDATNNKIWYYYSNIDEWKPIKADTSAVTVSQFTNDTAGIIKGSTNPGQLQAEADGTGSVVGWDGLQHDVDNLAELVNAIEAPKLYDTYSTATDGSNTAKFINSKLNTSSVSLGVGSSTTGLGGVALGAYAKAGYLNGIAIGGADSSSGASADGQSCVAIGISSKTDKPYAVALGSYSVATRSYEVSFGDGVSSHNYGTRYLANVKAGELDTDAVNLKQMQDYVAEHAGEGNDPRLTDTGATRANNLPLQVFYTTGPTDYNGDNIEVHLIQKDLATGGDATMPFTIRAATPTSAGVMTGAQVVKLNSYDASIANLDTLTSGMLNSAVSIMGLGEAPTQEELTAVWKGASSETELINRAMIWDETNSKSWYYFSNVAEWIDTSGEGTGVELLSAYTTTDIDGKAYNANYINNRLDISTVAIGSDATANTTKDFTTAIGCGTAATDYASTALGANAQATGNRSLALGGKRDVESVYNTATTASGQYAIAIGTAAQATRQSSIAIGLGATVTTGIEGIAIGTSANARNTGDVVIGASAIGGNAATATESTVAIGKQANVAGNKYGVALGARSTCGRPNEVSIGSGSATAPTTRLLANVTAGTNDTDAVNKKQMEDYVAAQPFSLFAQSATSKPIFDTFTTILSLDVSQAPSGSTLLVLGSARSTGDSAANDFGIKVTGGLETTVSSPYWKGLTAFGLVQKTSSLTEVTLQAQSNYSGAIVDTAQLVVFRIG